MTLECVDHAYVIDAKDLDGPPAELTAAPDEPVLPEIDLDAPV